VGEVPVSTPERPELLAIIAPDFRAAQVEAQERGLNPRAHQGSSRTWIYVQTERDVLGREPGRYAVRWWEGARMDGSKLEAWDWMIRRGWRSADDTTTP
jgi:hypothetical protein